jgi:glycosyltransferase involved in cell wall biosynthesis
MKLVIATPLYPPEVCGPATYARALHDEWSEEGIVVRVVAYGRLERILPIGLRHLVYFFRLLPALPGARGILALDTWSVGIPALVAAGLSRKRLVVRIGGDFLWESYVGRTAEPVRLSAFYTKNRPFTLKERAIYTGTRWLVRRADVLAFNTAWQRDIWQRAYGFENARATVVENFFPEKRETSEAKGRVFVAAGRDHPLKNQALLERIIENLKKEYPDIALDTRKLPPLEHHARLRDAYAVIGPSVSEVNPNTAIDAIGAGKPFIAPIDSGGATRLAQAGVCLDAGDAGVLELAIRDLLNPISYEKAVARVRAFSYSRSWKNVADDFKKFFSV